MRDGVEMGWSLSGDSGFLRWELYLGFFLRVVFLGQRRHLEGNWSVGA